MHGCCLGTDGSGCNSPGLGNFPWGYLGDMGDDSENVSTLDSASLGLPGGVLDPIPPSVTVGDLSDYMQTGNADPSIINQLSSIVQSAGPAISQIMQQYQLGQIASSQPLANNPVLRAALVTSPNQTGITGTLQSLASSPVLLIGAGVLAFLVLGKKRGK